MTHADLHTMTGAYAVHALPVGEREDFERHLAVCDACAQEVRELTATAERLGLAETVTPPPEMRERVLRQIATVRQEPPRVSPGHPVRSGGRWARSLPKLAPAAALAAAASLGGVAVWQHEVAQDAQQQAQQSQQRAAELARVLAAPDAKVHSGRLPDGGAGSVVVSQRANQAAFVASGMPAAPDGKTYELWYADGGTMRPAGLTDGGGEGTTVLMDGKVDGATAMGVTVEPDGGSPQPTSDPVLLIPFGGGGASA
jgi:anti-sigma-K factor RskA